MSTRTIGRMIVTVSATWEPHFARDYIAGASRAQPNPAL
jgi:hypothetical protein